MEDIKIEKKKRKEVNNYHQANTAKCLKGMNAFNLYEKLYKDKSAYVLTSSFRKITNNSTQSINCEGEVDYAKLNCLTNQIQLCYMLKKNTTINKPFIFYIIYICVQKGYKEKLYIYIMESMADEDYKTIYYGGKTELKVFRDGRLQYLEKRIKIWKDKKTSDN